LGQYKSKITIIGKWHCHHWHHHWEIIFDIVSHELHQWLWVRGRGSVIGLVWILNCNILGPLGCCSHLWHWYVSFVIISVVIVIVRKGNMQMLACNALRSMHCGGSTMDKGGRVRCCGGCGLQWCWQHSSHHHWSSVNGVLAIGGCCIACFCVFSISDERGRGRRHCGVSLMFQMMVWSQLMQ